MAEIIYAGDAGAFKACSKCEEIKPLSSYTPRIDRPTGFVSSCKSCMSARSGEYKALNAEKVLAANLKRKQEKPELAKAASAKFRIKNRERILEKERLIRVEKGEEIRARERELYAINRLDVLKRKFEWRQKNLESMREYEQAQRAAIPPDVYRARVKEQNRRKRSTVKGRLENSVRAGMYVEITKGSKRGRKTFDLLGYTVDDLKSHLEKLFLHGMSWENYGDWHIDHEIPLAAHNYETPDDIDFKRAWALSNLRPLWAFDNKSKGAKLFAGFQPSLALACG